MNPTTRLTPGLSRDEALRIYAAPVNQEDTPSADLPSLAESLEQMRAVLSDPITSDEADALNHVLYGEPPPPTSCPDCGSNWILPISYGRPRPETVEEAQRHEIVLGGCIVGTPRWHCNDCFNRWPEDPPPNAIPESQLRHLAKMAAEQASFTRDAAMLPKDDEPAVENYWQRPDGRSIFLLRFPWGRMRMEKRLHLVPLGHTPVYEHIFGWPPMGDYTEIHRSAVVAAMRYERKLSGQ